MPERVPESFRKMYVPLEFRSFYLRYKDQFLHELWKLLKLLEDMLQDKFEFVLILLKANKYEQAKRLLKETLCQCAETTTTTATTSFDLESIKRLLLEMLASFKHEVLQEVKQLLSQHASIISSATANTNVSTSATKTETVSQTEFPDFIKDNPWVSIIANKYRS